MRLISNNLQNRIIIYKDNSRDELLPASIV
jgi:hypothetical protein